MENPENFEYLNSLEGVGGRGDAIPNMLILSEKQRLEKWFEEYDLEYNVVFAGSDNAYSNNAFNGRS